MSPIEVTPVRTRRACFAVGSLLFLFPLLSDAIAQEPALLPFAPGERLEYSVSVSRVRASGKGSMTVEGPSEIRGTNAWILRFDLQAGLGPLRAIDRTESWIDPLTMATLRFSKHERHPLSSGVESVEVFPGDRRWENDAGAAGETPTDDPLDELSFIYFIRTLPLPADTGFIFNRHFRRDRNPVSVRVTGRETISTGIGRLETIVVEMRVRDPGRYRDAEGVIRMNITDDARRIPARIESTMPLVGRTVLTLTSIRSGEP